MRWRTWRTSRFMMLLPGNSISRRRLEISLLQGRSSAQLVLRLKGKHLSCTSIERRIHTTADRLSSRFVYGGAVNSSDDANKPTDDGYLKVYALSIPAFRWFMSNSSTTQRRACHACSIVGNRQMMSIGGRLVNTATTLGMQQDPWTSSIGVFDMTAFAWKDAYDPHAAAYDSPDPVKQYYSSEYQEPTWADPALAQEFRRSSRCASF